MLLTNFQLLQNDPSTWVALLLVVAFAAASAVTIHEAAHAWTALRLGDRTAFLLGRVTLNPRAHIDPNGAILFLLVFFGWGKPTPVNPLNMVIDPRRGMALVSAAGPVSNVLLATLFALPFRAGFVEWRSPAFNSPFSGGTAESIVADFLVYGILLNSFLAVFNLIPLPPLDGFKLAVGILPTPAARKFNQLGRYGFGPFMVLLFLEFFTPVSVLSGVLVPFADLIIESVSGHSVR